MVLTPDDIFRANCNLAVRNKSKRAAYTQFTPRRVDKNQPSIVKDFRKLGARVTHLHMVGNGVWDLAVAISWLTCITEVKDGEKPPSARKFTPDERDWGAAWPGLKGVACNSDDVASIVSSMRHILNGGQLPSYQIGNQEAQYRL